MKKSILTALFALILVFSLFAMAACNPSVQEITLDKSNMPQTVYVQGSELNLEKGSLLADGNVVPFSDGGVTISGYDKDKLGQQTLTVTYGGKELKYNVNVVTRISTSESYMYFVGEDIADAEMRLKITRDDGTSINVSVPSEGLTITGFDSSKATDKLTLNVTYNKDGEQFSGTVDVAVCNPDIKWTNPRKLEYGNEETELDMTGASLALKSPDGSTTRYVDMTMLEVAGYDPSVINKDNQTATQTITVTYLNRQVATFNVTVTYSDVSRFKDAADELMLLDWDCYSQPTSEDPSMKVPAEATEDMQQEALELLELYLTFKTSQKDAISQNQFDAVARLAVVYAYNNWMQAVERGYSDVIDFTSGGTLTYLAESRDVAAKAVEKYKASADEDTQEMILLSGLLSNETLFELTLNTRIYTSVVDDVEVNLTAAALALVIKDTVFMQRIFQSLEWAIEVYDSLSVIQSPESIDGWSEIDLVSDEMKLKMETAYISLLTINQYNTVDDEGVENGAVNSTFYPIINSWREKSDLFEILYRYYFALSESEGTSIDYVINNISKLSAMMLPPAIEELRQTALIASTAQYVMQGIAADYQEGTVPYLTESALFMYYYKALEAQCNEFLAGEIDVVYYTLYQIFVGDVMSELMLGEYGYLQLTGKSAYDNDVIALWTTYTEMWAEYFLLGGDLTDEQQAELDQRSVALFNQFVDLQPIQQRYFLSALNYLGDMGFPTASLYPVEGYLSSEFANFIYNYYLKKLDIDVTSEETDTAYNVFTNLMLAIEWYADGYVDYFCSAMETAIDEYNQQTWVNADKTAFDRELKTIFDKYVGYYNRFVGTPVVDDEGNPVMGDDGEQLIEWTYNYQLEQPQLDLFKKIYEAQAKAELAALYINYTGMNVYTLFLSSYEVMMAGINEVLTSGDQDLINAYYFMPFSDPSVGGQAESLYNGTYGVEDTFQQMVRLFGFTPEQYLAETQLRDFLRKYQDFFWTSAKLQFPDILPDFNEDVEGQEGATWTIFREFDMTAENINTLTTEFANLSVTTKSYLITFDMSMAAEDGINMYYNGILIGLGDAFDETQLEVIVNLISLEINCLYYQLTAESESATAEDLETAKTEMLNTYELVTTGYQAFSAETKTLFDSYFSGMYQFYTQYCAQFATAL